MVSSVIAVLKTKEEGQEQSLKFRNEIAYVAE
jgi:hypothetical protein